MGAECATGSEALVGEDGAGLQGALHGCAPGVEQEQTEDCQHWKDAGEAKQGVDPELTRVLIADDEVKRGKPDDYSQCDDGDFYFVEPLAHEQKCGDG